MSDKMSEFNSIHAEMLQLLTVISAQLILSDNMVKANMPRVAHLHSRLLELGVELGFRPAAIPAIGQE